MNKAQHSLKVQKIVVVVSLLLFFIKIIAYYLTQSVSIFSDTLESTVNLIAGFIGLYSLSLAAKPKDEDHPYGHGKAEFVSAAIEGAMIIIAGLIIIYESVNKILSPNNINSLDIGIILIVITAVVNYITGVYCINYGEKNNSLALKASGKHLQSDTYSTLGIVIGLIIIYFTKLNWLDCFMSILFSILIIRTGLIILRDSLAGIMDETDIKILEKLVKITNNNRNEHWIDLHNLRVIKYGSTLHVDCHLTLPWYLNVNEAHCYVKELETIIAEHIGESIELFIHVDGCLPFSCEICRLACDVRKRPFKQIVEWTVENISKDHKHQIE